MSVSHSLGFNPDVADRLWLPKAKAQRMEKEAGASWRERALPGTVIPKFTTPPQLSGPKRSQYSTLYPCHQRATPRPSSPPGMSMVFGEAPAEPPPGGILSLAR